MAENARLRRALAASHAGARPIPAEAAQSAKVQEVERELAHARAQVAALAAAPRSAGADERERIARLEKDLADTQRRFAELEEQNNNLANLYVASYQLHSTLDFKEVIAIVMEIVTNLVGAEVFCLMLVDGKTGELNVITAEGMTHRPTAKIPLGDGIIGRAAKTGEAYYRGPEEVGEVDFFHPLAAIPLKIKEHVIGMISVMRLFPQKEGFSSVDYELFKLLAGHAATAVFSAKLYSESERKLSTIQSFLDLLTTS